MDPAEGTPPGNPQGSLLGDVWRATPRAWKAAGALVLAGLAAWGLWALWDGRRRETLRKEIEAVLATLPPEAPDPFVEDEENGAVLYRQALESIVFAKLDPGTYVAFSVKKWTVPPKELEAALAAHAETLRLLEEALGKPSFSPGNSAPQMVGGRPASCFDLVGLAAARGLAEVRTGRPGPAVRSALLVHRMARQAGPGRIYPWFSSIEMNFHTPTQILREAVADPGLDEAAAREILDHGMSGEEARAFFAAAFEAQAIRMTGRSLADWLGGEGEARARAMGWRPPSLRQKLLTKLGKGGGRESFPTTGQFERQWHAIMAARARAGTRGKEAAAALVGGKVQRQPGQDHDWAGNHAMALRMAFTSESWQETIRTAAALRLFEMRRGRAPAALAELVPEFLPAPPRDPFNDGPLQYECAADGWTVSSAGPPGEWGTYVDWSDLKASITWKRPTPANPNPK